LQNLKHNLQLYTEISSCQICRLCQNQPPIYDKKPKSQIFWVGLSAVRFDDFTDKLPLDPCTKSGALIQEIEAPLSGKIAFYKTNLVKCPPLKDNGKIRYPNKKEMKDCCAHLEKEIEQHSPSIIFLLGKQVASFVLKKHSIDNFSLSNSFEYDSFTINRIKYVPVHHPSYVLIYKRKHLQDYINNIRKLSKRTLMN